MSEKIGPKEVCWDFITRKTKVLPKEEKKKIRRRCLGEASLSGLFYISREMYMNTFFPMEMSLKRKIKRCEKEGVCFLV